MGTKKDPQKFEENALKHVIHDVEMSMEEAKAAMQRFVEAYKLTPVDHATGVDKSIFILLDADASSCYPLNTETLIHRPPGQCITISLVGNAELGTGGGHAELWLDISGMDDVDLLNLKEMLIEDFSAFWDFPVTVTLPGEE